jgi:DNA-binding FrmR family transcriptional regulator
MHTNHKKIDTMLKTAKGQVEGVIKMVADDRYCIDITNQILAIQSLLKSVTNEILKSHLQTCVIDAKNNKEQLLEKVNEVVKALERIND